MMKMDKRLTAILDEKIDNVEDLNAKYQLVKELNSYFSNKVNQLQSEIDIHKKNVTNVNRGTVNNVNRGTVNNVNQIGNDFYETYVWFSHLRTHSDGNACQPLTQIFLPNQKKIKLKDRRFRINQRQYEKVCIQCNQDEDRYKKVTRSSYS